MDNSTTTDAAETAADAARRIKEAGVSAFDHTKQAASQSFGQGAERVTGSVSAAANSLRRVADEVQGEHAWVGAALRKSADGLERATKSFSGGDLDACMQDLAGFAHRQPAVFLGSAFALGFALARIGKTAMEKAGDHNLGAMGMEGELEAQQQQPTSF